MRISITILLFFSWLVSCNIGSLTKEEEELVANFETYLSEVCAINPSSNQLYYVIPMLGCGNCIDNHFDILKNKIKVTTNITIILSGQIVKKKWLSDVEVLRNRYKNIVFDDKDKASIYNIGLMKPVVFEIIEEQWGYYNQIEDIEMDKVVDYINQR